MQTSIERKGRTYNEPLRRVAHVNELKSSLSKKPLGSALKNKIEFYAHVNNKEMSSKRMLCNIYVVFMHVVYIPEIYVLRAFYWKFFLCVNN